MRRAIPDCRKAKSKTDSRDAAKVWMHRLQFGLPLVPPAPNRRPFPINCRLTCNRRAPAAPKPLKSAKCLEFQPNQGFSNPLPVQYTYTACKYSANFPNPRPSFHKNHLTPDTRIDYKMPHNPVHVLMRISPIACDNVLGRCTVKQRHRKLPIRTGLGVNLTWLKSSSRNLSPWRTLCAVSSAKCNRKTSSRKSRSIVSI
jgi:hypothetical protein